jgi:hypothetical protein
VSELEPSGCGGAQWHDVGEGLIRLCGRDFLREPARHQVTQHRVQAADDPIPGSAQVAVGHRGVPRLQALDRGSTSPPKLATPYAWQSARRVDGPVNDVDHSVGSRNEREVTGLDVRDVRTRVGRHLLL